MPMRPEVRVAASHYDEALHRIGGCGVDVVMGAGARTRRRLRGELIQQRSGQQLHAASISTRSWGVLLVNVWQKRGQQPDQRQEAHS